MHGAASVCVRKCQSSRRQVLYAVCVHLLCQCEVWFLVSAVRRRPPVPV